MLKPKAPFKPIRSTPLLTDPGTEVQRAGELAPSRPAVLWPSQGLNLDFLALKSYRSPDPSALSVRVSFSNPLPGGGVAPGFGGRPIQSQERPRVLTRGAVAWRSGRRPSRPQRLRLSRTEEPRPVTGTSAGRRVCH